MPETTDELKKAVSDLRDAGAFWSEALEPLIDLSPGFAAAYIALAKHPWKSGPLPIRIKHLIGLALNAAPTCLYMPGIRFHCRKALDAGASIEEILEALQLTSNLGIHACVLGVPILAEKLASVAEQTPKLDLSDNRRQQLKQDFIESRGYWDAMWDGLLALDPDYFEAFTRFSSMPWQSRALQAKYKELIYIATDVSVTHQFAIGTRIHIEKALELGASAEEILEVMEIAGAMGISTFDATLPILMDELAHR